MGLEILNSVLEDDFKTVFFFLTEVMFFPSKPDFFMLSQAKFEIQMTFHTLQKFVKDICKARM